MTEKAKQEMLAAIEAADSKKAQNLVILEMDQTAGAFTDYFIICTGSSSRQIQSISDEIELQVKRQTGAYAHQVEGYREGEWVLVDYMDFIVHIFSEERRAFYGLERLWKSARALTLEEFKAIPPEKPAKKKPAVKAAPEKSRPAKALALASSRKPAKTAAKKKPAKKAAAKTAGTKTAGTKTAKKSLKKVATKSSKRS